MKTYYITCGVSAYKYWMRDNTLKKFWKNCNFFKLINQQEQEVLTFSHKINYFRWPNWIIKQQKNTLKIFKSVLIVLNEFKSFLIINHYISIRLTQFSFLLLIISNILLNKNKKKSILSFYYNSFLIKKVIKLRFCLN